MNPRTRDYLTHGLPQGTTPEQCEAWKRHQAGDPVPATLLPYNDDTCSAKNSTGSYCGYPLFIDGTCALHPASVTRQTTQPLRDRNLTGASDRAAYGIVTTMLGQMDVDPPYQRGSVWTQDQRIALVKSWLMGVPIPTLIVNDRASAEWREATGIDVYEDGMIYALVDGKQRVETAAAWFGDRLAVPASWFPADSVERTEDTADGPYVRYSGLTLVARRFCHRWRLPVVEAHMPTVQAEAELYLLVNGGGTAQTAADMDRATRVAGESG